MSSVLIKTHLRVGHQIDLFKQTWNKEIVYLFLFFYGLGDLLTTILAQYLLIPEKGLLFAGLLHTEYFISPLTWIIFLFIKLLMIGLVLGLYYYSNQNKYFLSLITLYGMYICFSNLVNIVYFILTGVYLV